MKLNFDALKETPILGIFKLKSNHSLFVIKDGKFFIHYIIDFKDTGNVTVYQSHNASKVKESFDQVVKKVLPEIVKDNTLPISADYKMIDDYENELIITSDYRASIQAKGYLFLQEKDVEAFADKFNFSFDPNYINKSIDYKPEGQIILPKTKNITEYNHWNEEERELMAIAKQKFGDIQIPQDNQKINNLIKFIKRGLVKLALFYGPAATGKTTLVNAIGVLLNVPVETVSVSSDADADDFAFLTVPIDTSELTPLETREKLNKMAKDYVQGEVDHDGFADALNKEFNMNANGIQIKREHSKFLRRFNRGGGLAIEEMNNGRPSIFAALATAYDGTETVNLSDRTFRKHPAHFAIVCINPLYDDKEDLEQAFVSRFQYTIRFDEVSKEKYITYMKDRVQGFDHDPLLEKIYDLGERINNFINEKHMKYRVTFRSLESLFIQMINLYMITEEEGNQFTKDDLNSLIQSNLIDKAAIKENDNIYVALLEYSEPFIDNIYDEMLVVFDKGYTKKVDTFLGLTPDPDDIEEENYLEYLHGFQS